MNSYLLTLLSLVSTTVQFRGRASYSSEFGGLAACSIPGSTYKNWASVGPQDYKGSEACGQCLYTRNPKTGATTMAHVVDKCIGCKPGDISLSPSAFSAIGNLAAGNMDIEWFPVPCNDIIGNLQYNWHSGSNEWWGAVQILNHVQGVKSVEVGPGPNGPFTPLVRQDDDYFRINQKGPFTLRVTGVDGRTTVTDSNLKPQAGGVVTSSGQL